MLPKVANDRANVTKWRHWGMLIHGETNFVLVRTLYVLDCHRRRDIRPSRLYLSPRARLGSIGVPRRALGARKFSVGRTRIRTSVIKIFLKN